MALDLTTFTKVDPTSVLSVTATDCTMTNEIRNQATYLYYDYGAAYFAANFDHCFDLNITGGTNGQGICFPWALCNDIGDMKALETGNKHHLLVQILYGTTNSTAYIREVYNNVYYGTTHTFADSSTIYFVVSRDEAVGTYGTLYLKAYSDAARTNLSWSISVALHAKLDFRYYYANSSYNDASSSVISGVSSNYTTGIPLIVSPGDLAATFTMPAVTPPQVIAPGHFAVPVSMPDLTVVYPATVPLDTMISTFTMPSPEVNKVVLSLGSLSGAFTMPSPVVGLPSIVVVSPLTGVFVMLDPSVIDKSILIGVRNFPSGQTVQYKLSDDNGVVLQDWTSVGVVERAGTALSGKSNYIIRTLLISQNFQGTVEWQIPGTKYYASEIINIYESYTDVLYHRLTQGRANNLDNLDASVSTRLPTASYTAPTNHPTLAEIEASTVLAKEATSQTMLTLMQKLDRWKNNKLKRISVIGTIETWVLYADDNVTPELTWTHDISTMTRTKAT